MTKRQRDIFEWVKSFVAKWNIGPTLGEIGSAHKISKQRAREHILALQRQGLLTYATGIQRGTMTVDRCPTCGSLLRCCEPAGE